MKTEAPMFEPIAANLRLQRQDRGLSQAQLARRAGISSTTIRKAEDGRYSHHRATLAKIARALGVDVQTLLR